MAPQILFLAPDMFGPPSGIGRQVRLAAAAMREVGSYQLTVVALADSSTIALRTEEVPEAIRYLPCDGSRWRFAWRVIECACRMRPVVVLTAHANFAHLGYCAARLAGAKFVTIVHGVEAMQPMHPWRRWGLCHADRVFAVSRFTAQQAALHNGVDPARLRILHNCLDPTFQPRAVVRPADTPPSLLTVGRISLAEQYKGHDYVLRALPALLPRFPDLTYQVAGDGDGRAKLEALASELGVAHAVRFHGVVSDRALHDLYAAATLYVMPSRAEGFGFVFLEAMVHGLPVVAGNLDATPEVVADGETGLLVDPTCVDALTGAISRLLHDPDLRARMGDAGRRRVAEHFSFERFTDTLLGHVAELEVAR